MSKSACTTKASFVYENTQANPLWGEGLFQAAAVAAAAAADCLVGRLQKRQFGAGRKLGWGVVLDTWGSLVFGYVNGQVGGGKGRCSFGRGGRLAQHLLLTEKRARDSAPQTH